jgi:gluconate 2-dehydrogenase gamma chain
MPDNWSFTPHERRTAEAAMARIIPTDDTPGAREADTITFLERYLSGIGAIYARPDGSGFETLTGKQAEAWRRRIDILRARYREGLRDLDSRAQALAGRDFADLAPDQQDDVLRTLEETGGEPTTLAVSDALGGPVSAEPALQQTSTEIDLAFFPLLVAHTRQGFYADPIYGGNKGQVGWEVIGFPGPASLAEVHTGRYSTLRWFAEGEADTVKAFHHGV